MHSGRWRRLGLSGASLTTKLLTQSFRKISWRYANGSLKAQLAEAQLKVRKWLMMQIKKEAEPSPKGKRETLQKLEIPLQLCPL